MARQKKETVETELTPEQIAENKERIFNSCILKQSAGFSKSEINKFLKMCEELRVTQWDLVHLCLDALFNDKIEYEVETKTTLKLK